jgi:hypothetical protein
MNDRQIFGFSPKSAFERAESDALITLARKLLHSFGNEIDCGKAERTTWFYRLQKLTLFPADLQDSPRCERCLRNV